MDYMTNEFTNLDGVKIFAEYSGGQSRYGNYAVDYELVKIDSLRSDGEVHIELYAETEPTEGNESFDKLMEMIAEQAEKMGIDLDLYNPIFD